MLFPVAFHCIEGLFLNLLIRRPLSFITVFISL